MSGLIQSTLKSIYLRNNDSAVPKQTVIKNAKPIIKRFKPIIGRIKGNCKTTKENELTSLLYDKLIGWFLYD